MWIPGPWSLLALGSASFSAAFLAGLYGVKAGFRKWSNGSTIWKKAGGVVISGRPHRERVA
jgi:hypothetical protein